MVELCEIAVAACLWMLLLPVSSFLHIAGFRRVAILSGRIGHLAIEPDCFLKKRALNELPSQRWFMVASRGRVANRHLVEYWRRHIKVITHPVAAWIVDTMSRWFVMRYDVSSYALRLNDSAEIFRVAAAWGDRKPLLELDEEDRRWGASRLRELGMPADSWFVVVHVREAGFSPGDEVAHAHRNGSIAALIPTLQSIVARGGWCVRLGDPTMTPLPQMAGVIDYAHHPLRSERMDVFLCASARLFVGNTSGLAFVSSIFGVPSARANMVPTSELGLLPGDLSIPKLLWSEKLDRFLRFDEILGSPVGNFRFAALYAGEGIRPTENSAQDIQALVEEMLDKLEGRRLETAADRELQARFRSMLRPGHFSYGSPASVAGSFLRAHLELLPDRAIS